MAANPAQETFGFALYARIAAANTDSNVILSPVSASLALALATEGAGASTRTALVRTLGAESLSPEQFTQQNAALLKSLATPDQVTLTIANALWGDAGVPFDQGFVTRLAAEYRATIETADLQSSEFPARVNAWVSKQTAGKVPTLIGEPLDTNAVLFLANAVYFKGKWAAAFEPSRTAPAPFHLPNGQSRKQPFMRREGSYAYFADSAFRIARLPYRGDQFAMYVILPAKDARPIAVYRPNETWFNAAVQQLAPTDLAVALPSFVVRYASALTAPLAAMGAAPAFAPGADFSRLIPDAALRSRSAYIRSVLQQTYVEVNEEGTEAAAATTAEMMVDTSSTAPKPFVVDRAFVIVIRDDETGALLFLGQITNPVPAGT
jgi:serpin B